MSIFENHLDFYFEICLETCFLIRIRHLLNENTLFGTDVDDRVEKDLSMHYKLLKKFYDFNYEENMGENHRLN